MRHLLYVAAAMSVVAMAASCKREQQNSTKLQELAVNKTQFTYLTEDSIIKSETGILIDSNTAIIRIAGDTLFPRWYRKKLAEAGVSTTPTARWAGDAGVNGTPITLVGNILEEPVRANPAGYSNVKLHYSMSPIPIGKTGLLLLHKNDSEFSTVKTYTAPTSGTTGLSVYDSVYVNAQDGSYFQLEMDTYDSDNKPVVIVSDYWYVYGWQSVDGYGTAYGADMKVCNLNELDYKPDIVVMTSCRSGSSNGVSYRVLKNVNSNITSFTSTNTVVNLMDGDNNNYYPLGGAIAVGNINGSVNGGKQDFVLVTYTRLNASDNYSWRYKIAYDIQEDGTPLSYSPEVIVPGVGNDDIKEIGAALADINGDGTLELVLAAFHNTIPYNFEYKIGRNINIATGQPTWDATTYKQNISNTAYAGGIDIAKIQTNESTAPTSLFWSRYNYSGFPVSEAHLSKTTGLTVGSIRTFDYNIISSVSASATGGGVGVGDIDRDAVMDVINMAYFNNRFYFHIGYGMMENGTLMQFKHGVSTTTVN